MKLREYWEALNNVIDEHPEYLDEEVYYFFDEDGNYYHKVDFTPDYDGELEDGKGGFVIN